MIHPIFIERKAAEVSTLLIITTLTAFLMASVVIVIRMKAIKQPATFKKIVLPPFFMATGALMFVYPPARPTGLEVGEALLVGFVFSFLLMATTSFEIRERRIFVRRSKAFSFILVGLLIVRTIIKLIIGDAIEPAVLAGMFFLLAFAMLVPWRVYMAVKYKQFEKVLQRDLEPDSSVSSRHSS
ncbi:Membrane protein CcdC involved in cytochrome C biogenesis [Marinococcus luteus]|uniref:Membrane protein CcdC involved in cytochrome C biogenesis n=1 Tax=Marinococcus luteus TaxID=1122204 RepID=A0A1H2R2G8_9BACI|nr:Membrane protein CcdC involved in cytochrome C biogenesis [Marinococcus luteus]